MSRTDEDWCEDWAELEGRLQFYVRRAAAWKEFAKQNRVDICPNCGRECDPTTCWCGDDHRKSYGDGGHSHIPMGCVCGYDKDVARDHHVLKKMLLELRVERDKYKGELESLKRNIGINKCDLIFCPDPACPQNNPRT